MSEALLNCPFCDSFCVDIVSGRHVYYWQQCKNCKCEGPVADSIEECVKKWNTRNALPARDTVMQDRKERDEWMDRALAAEALAERLRAQIANYREQIADLFERLRDELICAECSCVTCGDHGCPDCRPGEVWP